MVAVLHAAQQNKTPQALVAWLAGLAGTYPPDDIATFDAALAFARERCGDAIGADGESPSDRALETATIMAAIAIVKFDLLQIW